MRTSTIQIPREILSIIGNARIEGDALAIEQKLERSTYQQVAKILAHLGGKWSRKAEAHIFPGADLDQQISSLVSTGRLELPPDLEFFPTPRLVAEQLLAMSSLTDRRVFEASEAPPFLIIEPNFGEGHLATAAMQWLGTRVHGPICFRSWELDPALHAKAAERFNCHHGDFLQSNPERCADLVVMNPPFRHETAHVLHALKFLKPGAELLSVMSAGLVFRTSRAYSQVRERATDIVELPDGAFKAAGTSVRTVLVKICAQD